MASSEGDAGRRPAALDTRRTVLGWETCEPIHGRRFSKVVVMGPYWSGTNAVRDEVLWRFHVPVLNPDKLEVCAHTAAAVQSLSDGLARGPTVPESITVGKKRVPRGYRLLTGPSGHSVLNRTARARRLQPSPVRRSEQPPDHQAEQLPPEQQHQQQASDGPLAEAPTADAASSRQADSLSEAIGCLEPPVTVTFGPDTDGGCAWWKHAVRLQGQGAIDADEDTLVILVTKDPLFWLKSMSKHFYEMKVEGSQRTGLDALFGELEHDGRRYRDAVELWSTAMHSFLDEELYPSSRCVLLRYEDFLFRFWDVMVHLAALLPANGQRLKEPPNSSRSKRHAREVRGRNEALRFYASYEHRHCDFAPQHFERMRELCPELLRSLGYAGVLGPQQSSSPRRTLCTWVPELHVDDIVAARVRCKDADCALCADAEASDSGCIPGRAWARVVGLSEGGAMATVELLREVPREWLAESKHDWAVVEWPATEQSHAAARGRAGPQEQKVPCSWLDLRLPRPRCAPGEVLPLTEEGYRAAVALRSTRRMAEFISRVVAELEVGGVRAGRVLDRHKLLGFARWFSGEANVQSLAQIRRELPGKEEERWVTFAPPRPTRCLQPAAPPTQPQVEAHSAT